MSDLSDLQGSRWLGTAELWTDPLGNEAQKSDCTLAIDGDVIRYTWKYEGAEQHGSIALREGGADFTDTWHQGEPMRCRRIAAPSGLFQVRGEYGPDSDWGWRIGLSLRTPTGELVLQMTNIAPWGEEARAVRMVGKRQS